MYKGYRDPFPGSYAVGFVEFTEEFLVHTIICRECCGTGFSVDSLVTKKMYQKIIGMQKKFTQFGWFAAAILFYKVLNETLHLSLYMERDSVLIY